MMDKLDKGPIRFPHFVLVHAVFIIWVRGRPATYVSELHVLFVVNGGHSDLALGHDVIVVDVVRQVAHC